MTTTDKFIWALFQGDLSFYTNKIRFLLSEYGTKEPSNRFNVGNAIEFIMSDIIKDSCVCPVKPLPNARRIDLRINNDRNISIKYSSSGSIKLHNSNNQVNRSMTMANSTLLVTPTHLYFITQSALEECGIQLHDFLKNVGDGLILQRRILKQMELSNYPYIRPFDIRVDKNLCKHNLTSLVFYNYFTVQYNMQNV